MAYSKKTSRYRRRRAYRKRGFKRRKYGRRYYKKRSVRFPKNTEVKSGVKQLETIIEPETKTVSNVDYISYPAGQVMIIGGDSNVVYNIRFPQGSGATGRIGAKIEPVKLRLTGTIGLRSYRDGDLPETAHLNPQYWMVRLLVYQVQKWYFHL